MLNHNVVDIPIYKGKLIVVLTDSLDECIDQFGLSDYDDEYFFSVTTVSDYEGYEGYFIIFNQNKLSFITSGTLAHEAMHVVFELFQRRGVNITYMNQEHTTYFLAWVVNEIFNYLNECGIKFDL